MATIHAVLIWAVLVTAVTVPIIIAAMSPLLAWRDPIYIVSGFAGVVGLALMLFQPLLANGNLPGLPTRSGRRVQSWLGLFEQFRGAS